MRDCCPANRFSGCCEGIECTSGAVPLIKLDECIDGQERARRAMIDRILAGNLAVFALGCLVLSYLFIGIPEMQRWAKVDREIIAMETRK